MMSTGKRIKIIQINTVCNGSTGGIMRSIQERAIDDGYVAISCYGRRQGYDNLQCRKFGNVFSFWVHVGINTLFDLQGSGSYFSTRRMVKFLRQEQPDIIHLHNLHGYYINLNVLFKFLINEYKGRIVWTFHDLWPITGHCPHFVQAKCAKWIDGCYGCPQKRRYPISYGLDMSRHNYKKKRRMFCELKNLVIICPSEWMYTRVKKSFLMDKDIRVIRNGIDLNIFKPYNYLSTIKNHSILEKKVILGVAGIWEEAKGLRVFKELSTVIPDEYVIILVGLNKKQARGLPENIIGITRITDKEKLAKVYSTADVFVNPSVEESFSLVTIEAIACGTPVVVLDTSAVSELVTSENGIVLHEPSVDDYFKAIQSVNKESDLIARGASGYSLNRMTDQIIEVYRENM